jgi:signal peptidase II
MQERRTLPPLIAVAAAVVAVDQLTKWVAVRRLADGHHVHIISTLQLRLVHNRGSAFGLGSRYAPLLALAAAVIVFVLLTTRHRLQGWLPLLALALVVGGATGNLLDRTFRHGEGFLGGAVVDFVDLQWWPVFNAADASITIGAALLVLTSSRES